MKISTYLKWIVGCILGILVIDIVLALLGIVFIASMILFIIKRTLFLIFHPIKFFKEEEKKNTVSFKDLIGFDWKDFIDIEKNEEKKTSNSFVDMLNEELTKMKNKKHQIQKNNAYSKNNIQIGNINIKEE